MKPAPFVYRLAHDVEEALALLGELGDDARVIAGGQSLVPMMNFRLARPCALVDLNAIEELAYVRSSNGVLEIAAMTRQRTLEDDPQVLALCPLMREATRHIGHFQIRNRGTIGGSLAHADPAAEYPAVVLALDAELRIQSRGGDRIVRAEDFFLGPFTTAIGEGELLVEVRVPAERGATAFEEVSRRKGDFAIVGVATRLDIEQGAVREARVALAGVAASAVRARSAEAVLAGEAATDEVFSSAAAAAASDASPQSDIHGSASYRRSLVETLTFRALRRAASKADEDAHEER